MENNSAEMLEVDEENGRQMSQYCLGLPTILRQILQHFSTKELLNLSLVNKLWNYEAQSVMKKRGSLRANAYIGGNDEYEQCQSQTLVALANDLGKMRVVPFCGIHVDLCDHSFCDSISNESIDQAYKQILDLVPWKHFSVRFFDDWESYKDCPTLVLVQKILEDKCGVLEELKLAYGAEEFYQNIFRGRSWPCLKTLKIRPGDPLSYEPLTSAFIKTLVSYVPNLKELHVDAPINLTVNVLEGCSAVLVPDYRFRPLFEPICEDLIGSTRATFMEMRVQSDDFDPGLLNTLIPKLLEASRDTLTTLFMDLLFAVPLMSYGICLENVTNLEIAMNGYTPGCSTDPSITALAKGLDFTRIFPKVTQVKIMDDRVSGFTSDVVGAFVEEGKAIMSRALPDRAINIKTLNFDQFTSIWDATPILLAQIFPHVKTVQKKGTPKFSFTILKEHFHCLEEVVEIPYHKSF